MNFWRYIEEHDVSASHGLAADELLLQSHASRGNWPATLKLYTYRNYCALCGRFQHMTAEIDVQSCRTHDVQIGRRLTGGGAIIMGNDQLGICLATHTSAFAWNHIRDLYQLFSRPIIDALAVFGVKAGFRSRNDLEVDGKKVAGLGIHISQEGAVQFHSSLLLDLEIPKKMEVLNIPIQKYSDRRVIQAVSQRMTTVRREAGQLVTMKALQSEILKGYSKAFGVEFQPQPFSSAEKSAIRQLEEEKYNTGAWLFQHSPQEDMTGMSLKKTPDGLLRTYIGLKGDNIKSVMITGDLLAMPSSFTRIETLLKWSPLEKEKISSVIEKVWTEDKLHNSNLQITPEHLTDAIWTAAQRAHAAHRYTYHGSCYYPKETA